jgi:hypothetical protein
MWWQIEEQAIQQRSREMHCIHVCTSNTHTCFGSPFNISGGQTTMIFDINYRFPRAYIHRHKLHTRPTGFTAYLLSRVEEMIASDIAPVSEQPAAVVNYYSASGTKKSLPVKKIYTTYPHGTADNHFSGDNVLNFTGKKGFCLTLTTRRDRFPIGLKDYMHDENVDVDVSKAKQAKVMRYENPIVAIKQVESPPDLLIRTTRRHTCHFSLLGQQTFLV